MTAFEAICQMWAEVYIPVLERWGFKVTEVPREPTPYLLGEKCWNIEHGKKTKARVVIYAFERGKEIVHIIFSPARSWSFYENASVKAQRVLNEIVERLVVSVTTKRHVRYRPYFVRKTGEKEVRFQFVFKIDEWRWRAWSLENRKRRGKPYELVGTPETDPVAIFPQFERAVWLELLI